MSWMIAWPPIRKISVYRWPRMSSKRMSVAPASSCGSLAESSFVTFLPAGSDTFSSPCSQTLGPVLAVIRPGSVHPFDRRAFPFRLDHRGPGEVYAQDYEPFTVGGAWQPVCVFLIPGRFGLQVDRQPAVRVFAKAGGCVPDRVAPDRVGDQVQIAPVHRQRPERIGGRHAAGIEMQLVAAAAGEFELLAVCEGDQVDRLGGVVAGDPGQRLVGGALQEVVAVLADPRRRIPPAVDDCRPVAAEELLLEQRHPQYLGPDQALLDRLRLGLDVEAGADPDPGELAEDEVVVRWWRVLLEHRVQRLKRSERILLGFDRLKHVAAPGPVAILPAPLAERRQRVLLLQLAHVRHVGLVIDYGAPQDQDPGTGRRGERRVHIAPQVSGPVGAHDREASGLGPGGALPDIAEVVRGDCG